MSNLVSWLLLGVAAAIIAPSALLALGALCPRIPYLGAWGSMIWPTLIGPATLVVSFGLVLALAVLRTNGSPAALVVACIGGAGLLATLVILVNQVIAAVRAGVPIRPSAFVAVGLGPKVPADDSVTFTTDPDGNPLRMLIYRPSGPDAGAPAPVIVYVHGGGWFQGAPDESSATLKWFADQGYLVLAPEYTLATDDRPTWDLAMPQVARALAWAARHGRDYGGDVDRIAVWGASAGANLTLAVTYAAAAGRLPSSSAIGVPRIAAVAGEVPAVDPAWIHHNSDPIWGERTRAMVHRYIGGSTEDHPDRLATIRVATYLSPHAPPTLLSVSTGDHLVPVEGIRQFVDEARASGVDMRATYRPWGDHVIAAIYGGLPSQTMLRQMLSHFRTHGV